MDDQNRSVFLILQSIDVLSNPVYTYIYVCMCSSLCFFVVVVVVVALLIHSIQQMEIAEAFKRNMLMLICVCVFII